RAGRLPEPARADRRLPERPRIQPGRVADAAAPLALVGRPAPGDVGALSSTSAPWRRWLVRRLGRTLRRLLRLPVEQDQREAVELVVDRLADHPVHDFQVGVTPEPAGDVLTQLLPLPGLRGREHLHAREHASFPPQDDATHACLYGMQPEE